MLNLTRDKLKARFFGFETKDIKMNRSKSHFLKISFVLAILLLVTNACSDNFESSIPYVQVDIQRNLTNLNELTTAGGAIIFPDAGFGGVVVFNTGILDSEYIAADLACPYESNRNIRVEIDPGGTATCPECGSTYTLWFGGTYASGPSKESLLPYNAFVSGGRLFVTN